LVDMDGIVWGVFPPLVSIF